MADSKVLGSVILRLCTSRIGLPLSVTIPFAPYRLPAELHQLSRDIGAGHGYDFDRQREGTQHGHQLGVVDDADEALRGGGDHFFARQRGSAALDQHAVGGGLIGAVDIEIKIARSIEIEFLNPRGAQFFGCLARARDCAGELDFAVFQHFDELIYGGSGADSQHHAAFDVAERGFCGAAFFFR